MNGRKLVNYAVVVIVTAIVVGAGTYFAIPPKEVTKTVTQTITATAVVTTPPTTPKLAGKIVLYAPAWGVNGSLDLVKLYNKERPDVTVEVIRGPSVWDEHVTRNTVWMREKYSGVDVLYNDDVFTLDGALGGNWVKLDDYFTSEEKAMLTDLQQHFMNAHGGLYRIAWGNGGSYVYYRKDLFAKEGVSPPKTWDEFIDVAKKLTKDLDGDGKIDQWGYVTQGTPGEMYNTYNEFLHQAGGDEWKLAPGGVPDPTAKKALQFLYDLEHTYKIMPPGITAIGYTESNAMLKEGKAAMLRGWGDLGATIVSSWGMGDVIGAMNFPAGDGGPWGIGHSWGYVVNAYGKNKDLAIDFVKFCFLNIEAQKIMAKAYEAPAIKSLYQDAAFMADLAKSNVAAAHFEEFFKWRFPRKFPAGKSVEYHEAYGREISRALTGEASIDEALIAAQKAIDPLLP